MITNDLQSKSPVAKRGFVSNMFQAGPELKANVIT